jgi:hypothetical protein
MIENANKQQIWLKKKDNLCFVVHTTLSVLNSCLWYLDSACSRHMTGDKTLFKELKEGRSGNIIYEDGSKSKVMVKLLWKFLVFLLPKKCCMWKDSKQIF